MTDRGQAIARGRRAIAAAGQERAAPAAVGRGREQEDDDVRRHGARDRLDLVRAGHAEHGEPRPLEVEVKRDRDVGVLAHHENARRRSGARRRAAG